MLLEGSKTKHGHHQLCPVLSPTFLNVWSLTRVRHEVTFNDTCFLQHINIEFLFKYFFVESHSLRSHEALKVILSFQNKRQSLEFVLELHSHANFFSFEVENSVTKVNENESCLVRISRISVLFKFDKLVFAM